MSTLQTIRSQLELYKIQHDDKPPTFAEMQDWNIMLNKSNANGLNPKGQFGPTSRNNPATLSAGNRKDRRRRIPHPRRRLDLQQKKTGELHAVAPASFHENLASPNRHLRISPAKITRRWDATSIKQKRPAIFRLAGLFISWKDSPALSRSLFLLLLAFLLRRGLGLDLRDPDQLHDHPFAGVADAPLRRLDDPRVTAVAISNAGRSP